MSAPAFTLHFATINTFGKCEKFGRISGFTLHFATINTIDEETGKILANPFTLHFATINTKIIKILNEEMEYLHYTLLLLILKMPTILDRLIDIYITLCYY